MSEKSQEQKLVDICFSIGLKIHSHISFRKMSQDEVAEWIRSQLKNCGFPTLAVGMSNGKLINKDGNFI